MITESQRDWLRSLVPDEKLDRVLANPDSPESQWLRTARFWISWPKQLGTEANVLADVQNVWDPVWAQDLANKLAANHGIIAQDVNTLRNKY